MRHIPEDELHAYLDQALSRSQCVEIESHLADCYVCQANRDGIAALRDRTTALLARLAPPRRVPMAFEALRRQGDQRASLRRRRLRLAGWAASLVAAVGAGWTAAALTGPASSTRPGPPAAIVETLTPAPALLAQAGPDSQTAKPEAAPAVAPRAAAESPADLDSAPETRAPETRAPRADSAREAKLAVLDVSPAPRLSPIESAVAGQTSEYAGIWRTMSWDGARSEAGNDLPHIEGLPVIRVQVQAGEQGRRPLMVVAQQLASGEVIETIEGPARDVSQLLSRRGAEGATALAPGEIGLPTPSDRAMAMQVGDRMLAVTGALPADSLRAMIRRINAEMRGK